jgi:trimeric autotransporter adhesin
MMLPFRYIYVVSPDYFQSDFRKKSKESNDNLNLMKLKSTFSIKSARVLYCVLLSITYCYNATAQSISGTVYEDVNYGGGAGRDMITSSGIARPNARVELYDNAGNYINFATTDALGQYSFGSLANAIFSVRVVNQTVSSSRPGYVASLFPVQTFRTDASVPLIVNSVTDRVGGEIPAEQDAPANTTNLTLAALNGVANQELQSITTADLSTGANVTGVDFGFNFDIVVNTNNAGQGSFRQFILNSNALGAESLLSQIGNTWNAIDSVNTAILLPAGRETSIFMISDGNAHPGLRAGLTNLLTVNGVAIITPLTTAFNITGANATKTNIDGGTQTANVGNTNSILLGTGGSVGIGPDAVAGTGDEMKLPQLSGPEIELVTNSLPNGTNGLSVTTADSVCIRNICVHSSKNFDLFIAGSLGSIIEQNVIGTSAISFTVPAVRTVADNIRINNTSKTGIARNNLVGFGIGSKIANQFSNAQNVFWQYVSNECVGVNNIAGISFNSNAGGLVATTTGFIHIKGNLCRNNGAAGISADLDYNPGNSGLMAKLIEENTLRDNGSAGIQAIQGDGNDTIRHNLIYNNGAMGVRVDLRGSPTNRVKITQNSIYDNGTIGIDLDQDTITVNNGITNNVTKANMNIDYPIFTMVALNANTLTVQGYVGSAPNQTAFANVTIEIFKGKANGIGVDRDEIILGDGLNVAHMSGERYLGTLTADANGMISGTLTVTGLSIGDNVVGTATDAAGNTSEFGAFQFVLDGLLPVTMRNFSAIKKNDAVVVSWISEREINVAKYIVERSNNGIIYSVVGEISATGKSAITNNYAFSDNNPMVGKNYYRLRLIDNNGKFSYSDIRIITFTNGGNTQITTYPNPTADFVNIQLPSGLKNPSVKLTNSNGQIVAAEKFNGNSVLRIDVQHLPRGVYYLEISTETKRRISPIVIN